MFVNIIRDIWYHQSSLIPTICTCIINEPITSDFRLPNHLVHLFIRKFLSEIRQNMPKLCGADETITIFIEDPERFLQTVLGLGFLCEFLDDCDKAIERDWSIT